jgi:hypothetical protein
MQRSCYSVEKYQDRWLVSVFGARVLICESKKAALRVVRQASDALCLHDGVTALCRDQLRQAWSGENLTEAAGSEVAN